MRKTLTEYLDRNFIRVNNSPVATPIFSLKKPGESLLFCIDYRGFNRITKKNKYFFVTSLCYTRAWVETNGNDQQTGPPKDKVV